MLVMHIPSAGHQLLLCLITVASYSLVQRPVSAVVTADTAVADATSRKRRKDRTDDVSAIRRAGNSDVIIAAGGTANSSLSLDDQLLRSKPLFNTTPRPSHHSTSFQFVNPKPADVKVECKALRSKRYISDGFCTSLRPVEDFVCTGHCLPIRDLPWYAEFIKIWSADKTKQYQCVDDLVRHRKVTFVCENGETRTYDIKVVRSCKCKRTARNHNQSSPADKPTSGRGTSSAIDRALATPAPFGDVTERKVSAVRVDMADGSLSRARGPTGQSDTTGGGGAKVNKRRKEGGEKGGEKRGRRRKQDMDSATTTTATTTTTTAADPVYINNDEKNETTN